MSAINGELLRFPQASGPEVQLVVWGDEYYARYETIDGFTVVYDTALGLYCYAKIAAGEFISTEIPISDDPPKGLRRKLREDLRVREQKWSRRKSLQNPSPVPVVSARAFAEDKGLLEGRKVHKGKVLGLTIVVEFQDEKFTGHIDEVSALFNQPGYSGNGNSGSVRDYFLLMSSGLLDYTNRVCGPVTLKRNKSAYITPRENLLVSEALTELKKSRFNFAEFDADGDGYVESITVLYPGDTVYSGWLWPHNWVIDVNLGEVSTQFYSVCSIGSMSLGTICHEAGHMLCRFPDLYDYGDRDGDFDDSAGLGYYCLMSYGSHTNEGRTPAPVAAYLRHLAGWTKTVSLNEPGRYEAVQGDYATIFKYTLPDKNNEYFLVENRCALGQDEHLCASGLAVYHCDIKGSNEWEEGLPERHYQCALLQADGFKDLETKRNAGDPLDLFKDVSGVALSYATNPSTTRWDRSDSGLIIANISPSGKKVAFEVQ